MRKQSILDKQIPNFLALFLIIVGLSATAYFTGQETIFRSGAAPSNIPQNVRIDNLSDTSFTITYTTNTPVLGSLSFGKDATLGVSILDDRDQTSNTPKGYTTHIMTIKNLLPNTQYYFAVVSGGTTYTNGSKLFTATTGPPINETSPITQILSGTITLPADNTGSGVLVYTQIPNGQTLATLSDLQGNYRISLANTRTMDMKQYASVKNTDIIRLVLTDGTEMSRVITTIVNTPLPNLILSQDYDFTMIKEPTTIPTETTQLFPVFSTVGNNTTVPAITNPQQNQNFTDNQPEFSGTAKPNTQVTIVIHSTQAIQTQVTADSYGQWTFRPEVPLTTGDHTITITATDATGNTKTITQSFTILPLGSAVFDTATPSATFTPTPTTTATNTPVPTDTPTTAAQTTTPASSPTITPTLLPTATPQTTITPTDTPLPTATPPIVPTSFIPSPTKAPLPSTGNASIFTIGIASIITTIAGLGLFFLTRGGSEL